MARVRSIRPTFWTDEKIAALPRPARLTFLGLISAMADDDGRCKGNARIVRGAIYPYDDDITVAEVEHHLQLLHESGRIIRYAINGDEYIQIRYWTRHQKVEKPSASLLPAPPSTTFPDHSGNGRGTFSTERSGAEAERNGADRSGKERSGAEAERTGDSPNGSENGAAPPAPPAPLSLLSLEAETAISDFIAEFYQPYPEKRRKDVRQQLLDARSEKGAKVRRGQFVRACDDRHLVTCIRAVIAEPPRDPDAAIVLVLRKLGDPPPGPSPAEQRAKDDTAERVLEEEYRRERSRAGKTWAHEHPDEYAALRREVESRYADVPSSGVRKKAIDVELAQKCGDRALFPPFDQWAAAGAVAGGA